MATAPQIVQALDDVSPQAGTVQYGQYTNDTAPVIRVNLGDQLAAGEQLLLSDNGQALGAAVTLTGDDLARGFVDVAVSGLADGWNLLSVRVTDGAGQTVATSMSFALGVATAIPVSPTITAADDGAGTTIADGGHTADTTPTFHIFEAGLPPSPTGSPGHAPYGGPALLSGHIQLFEGGQLIGDALIGFDGTVTLTSGALAPGAHTLTAVAIDRAGNASAPSAPFHIVIDGAAGQPVASHGGDLLQAGPDARELHGGLGADTLIGAAVDEVLMGGGGADSIVGGSLRNIVNGNLGEDTILGRSTVGDLLNGGQGSDLIDASASTGRNTINGNLGADTVTGGAGGDLLRGGQGDDSVAGGAAGDWISGDLGHNTLSGGGGADTFHAGAGVDTVIDFNPLEGDRVQIDGAQPYTATRQGADVLIDLHGHGQVVLAGVGQDFSAGWVI